jgi:hypothetical protein
MVLIWAIHWLNLLIELGLYVKIENIINYITYAIIAYNMQMYFHIQI